MAIEMVPWDDELGVALRHTLGESASSIAGQGRGAFGPERDDPENCWSRCVIVVDDGQAVGAAGAFHSTLHPHREWAYVEIVESRRGEGLASAALGVLTDRLPRSVGPLRGKVRDGTPAFEFAAAVGARPFHRSRTVRLEPDSIAHVAECSGGIVEVSRMDDASGATVEAWRRFYIDGHDWDPVGEFGSERTRELFFRSGGQVITIERDGDIVGVGLCDDDPLVAGPIDRTHPDGDSIVRAIIGAVARLSPGEPFDVEVDDWMTAAIGVVESVKHSVIETIHLVST